MSGITAFTPCSPTRRVRNGMYPGSSARGGLTRTSAAYCAGASGLMSAAITVAWRANELTMS